ncbi:hypothetical protein L7F22_008884 [Adiantum nelumboides]|nr:hypothetical protein [Adiantum nelumboides]
MAFQCAPRPSLIFVAPRVVHPPASSWGENGGRDVYDRVRVFGPLGYSTRCGKGGSSSWHRRLLFGGVGSLQAWFITKDMEGFDEYMNLVLDDAEEVSMKKKTHKPLGRILLQGDNIMLMMNM